MESEWDYQMSGLKCELICHYKLACLFSGHMILALYLVSDCYLDLDQQDSHSNACLFIFRSHDSDCTSCQIVTWAWINKIHIVTLACLFSGRMILTLYLMSDCYLGLDQQDSHSNAGLFIFKSHDSDSVPHVRLLLGLGSTRFT